MNCHGRILLFITYTEFTLLGLVFYFPGRLIGFLQNFDELRKNFEKWKLKKDRIGKQYLKEFGNFVSTLSKKFGVEVEYWALPGSNLPWRPCLYFYPVYVFVLMETSSMCSYALSFYRSQNFLDWSKIFVPVQKFIHILWQSQTFCASHLHQI